MIQTIFLPDIFTGNGILTAYPFTFRILTKADLLIIKQSTVTGLEVILELTSDYSVPDSDVGTDDGGTITFVVAPSATEKIKIYRHTARTQLINITEGSAFPAAVVTKEFDRTRMQIQELDESVGRALALVQKSVAVSPSAGGVTIVFETAMANALYNVLFITPSWQTTSMWSAKTTAGFLITFGVNAPVGGGTVVYGVSP